MVNLRYHIVSLTAVFLAIGIGLTLGSTFLDRATVDNLNGQLENLDTRLQERDARIDELETEQGTERSIQSALDEQALALLAGHLEGVPVAVMASRGVDEADVRGSLQALDAAEADVQGIFWFTDRFELDDAAEIDDLATVLGEESSDPSRLRRMVIDVLGDELRDRQLADVVEATSGEGDTSGGAPTGDTVPVEPTQPVGSTVPTGPTDGPDDELSEVEDLLGALVENGFIDFEPVPGTPETPRVPDGTRILLVGGSSSVPDDLVVEPLLTDMGSSTIPLRVVAGSARADEGEISDLVVVIREDEQLRELVSTVDRLEHFEGWAAMVLALAETGEGVVGHYGVAEGAARLLPQLPTP